MDLFLLKSNPHTHYRKIKEIMMNKFVKSILIMIIICFQYSFSQSAHYISGTVVDKNGEPLLGANINLKGTFLGSTTDANGYYHIEKV